MSFKERFIKDYEKDALEMLEDIISYPSVLDNYIENGGRNLSAIVLLSKLYLQDGDNINSKNILRKIPYNERYNLFDL